MAWLESPNGLGATAESQLRGEASRTKFPPILCGSSTSLGNERTDKPLFAVCPRGVDLISDALPFGRLWYGEPNAVASAIGYAMHCSRSHDAVIRVYDEAGNIIHTHEHKGDFKEW